MSLHKVMFLPDSNSMFVLVGNRQEKLSYADFTELLDIMQFEYRSKCISNSPARLFGRSCYPLSS